MKVFPAERSEDLTAFAERAMDSFLGRSVLRFLRMDAGEAFAAAAACLEKRQYRATFLRTPNPAALAAAGH